MKRPVSSLGLFFFSGTGNTEAIAESFAGEFRHRGTDPQNYIIYYFVLGLAAALALSAGKRSFCHHACWMAPFMVTGRKIRNLFGWPSLRLRAEKDICGQCGRCTCECPMSLPVQEMVAADRMERAECILWGTCVDNCPQGAIKYTW